MSNLYNLLFAGSRQGMYEDNASISRATKFFVMNDALNWHFDKTELTSRVATAGIEKLKRGNLIVSRNIAEHFEQGPKVFSMKGSQFEALEQTDLTLPIVEYQQPFKVVCFPIPEDYAKDRAVRIHDKVRLPKYVIINHELPNLILMSVVYNWDFTWSTFICPRDNEHSFEDKLEQIMIGESIQGTEGDLNILRNIARACLNAALIFDQVKTTSFSARSGKKPKKTDATYYGFDQSVKLFSTEECTSHDGQGEGSHVKSHWRRGHWRMQAHGVGLALRKRIRISPVLVRLDLFVGDLSGAKVNYANE